MIERRAMIAVLAGATWGCRREPTTARVDAAIAPLIGSGAVALVGLRIDRLKKTEFFGRVVAGGRIGVLEEFRAKTGLDPAKDVWEVVWSVEPGHGVVFVRGKFGGEFGLEPKFNVAGIERSSHKGYYILQREGRGVLFFNSGVAVVGGVEDLKAVVDNRDKAGEAPPRALIERVAELPACHAYAVAPRGGELAGALGRGAMAESVGQLLRGAGAVEVTVDFSDGAQVEAMVEAGSEALARQMADTARAAMALARLRMAPENVKALDEVRVADEGRRVRVTARVPVELAATFWR